MIYDNDYYKLDLAKHSYRIYDKFLHKVFLNSFVTIPERHLILLYCFLHKAISHRQVLMLFGNNTLNKKNALYMVLKRLRDNGYMSRQYNEDRKSKDENSYFITPTGVKYCMDIIRSLFSDCMTSEELTINNHMYSLDEILEYLSARNKDISPGYWNHYLSSRDVYTYLLSSNFTNMDFLFETEVGISENGIPITSYECLSPRDKKISFPIRSDALLTYPLADDKIKIFIELDTGSQSSTLLADKIKNYKNFYLETESFSPTSSLLFCLKTTANPGQDKLKSLKGRFNIKEYYYLHALQSSFELLRIVNPDCPSCETVGEAIFYLNELEQAKGLGENIKQVLTYFTKKIESYKTTPLSTAKNKYFDRRNDATEKRTSIVEKDHVRKYHKRRALLHRSVNKVSGLKTYFLQGFSLYTVSCYHMDETFPFLIPEMSRLQNIIKIILISIGQVNMHTIHKYDLLYKVGHMFVMRNSYSFPEDNIHIIIENISDDYGGYVRIQHLLNLEDIPSSLKSSKVICLLNSSFLEDIKKLYLESPIGKKLSDHCGSRFHKNKFEILFITYEDYCSSGRLFTFSSDGNIIYKR